MTESIIKVSRNECAGCGVCEAVCPTSAIHMREDEYGCLYPRISQSDCISCGACLKKCPTQSNWLWERQPNKVYAAWNKNSDQRRYAASGGIATAMYQYALERGIKTFGVAYEPGKGAKYIEIKDNGDIARCRNSKYVFSDITPQLPKIKEYLEAGQQVLLIGLPCQLAGVLSLVGGRKDNLILVDIVCHGTCPAAYLNQHIAHIEKKKKHTTTQMFFRDPEYGTNKYVFSLYEHSKGFYNRRVHMDDAYQIGYHKALFYRENCYCCKYAQPRRIGDLTISDFSGLGRCEPVTFDRKSVSCVMVSSLRGEHFWEELIGEGKVESYLRPSEEAFAYEKQLRRPSIPHKKRSVFLNTYAASGDFEKSAKKAVLVDTVKNMTAHYLRIESIKAGAVRCIPKSVKGYIKRLVRK